MKSCLYQPETGQRNTAFHEAQRTAAPAPIDTARTVSMSHDKQSQLQNKS